MENARRRLSKERIALILSMILGLGLAGILAVWILFPSQGLLGESFRESTGKGLLSQTEILDFRVRASIPYSIIARTRATLATLLGIWVAVAAFLPSKSSRPASSTNLLKKNARALCLLFGGGIVISLVGLIFVPGTVLSWQGQSSLFEVAAYRTIFSAGMAWLLMCLMNHLIRYLKFE